MNLHIILTYGVHFLWIAHWIHVFRIVNLQPTKNSRLEYKGCAYEVLVVKDVELPIHILNVQDLDEMPSSLGLGINLKLLCLPSLSESFPCYFQLEWSFHGYML
jgi:hypothetical protein